MRRCGCSGTDTIRRQNFIYSDTPSGRILAALYNVWAANCVSARAETIASVPLKLYKRTPEMAAKARRRKGKASRWDSLSQPPCAAVKAAFDKVEEAEEIDDHPCLTLLEDVNPINLDKNSYREQLGRQLAIHGTAFTHKIRDLDDSPKELYILAAQYTEPLPDPNTFVAGYRYMGQYIYDPKDVLRIYYPSDDNPLLARSPTSTALSSINSYNMADIAQQGIDRRGGQGGGIIAANFENMQVDPERFMAEWDSKRSDPNNAGRDAFLAPGFDYKQGVLTAQEQQREQRSMRLIKEIMSAYRIPPSLAGDYSDASVLANAAQQSTNFWQTWVLPELRRIEETMTYFLLWADWPETKDEGLFLAHDVSEIPALQADALAEAQVQQAYVSTATDAVQGGIWSVNEGRAYTGEERIENDIADDVLLVLSRGNESVQPVNAETGKEAETLTETKQGVSDAAPMTQTQTPVPPPQPATTTPPPVAAAPTATPVIPAKAYPLSAIVDVSGMAVLLPDGARGTVGKIKRFGAVDGLEATKADPLVMVGERWYKASAVQVVID